MAGETHDGRGTEESSRQPKRADLSLLCAELNRLGARYLVVGGFAIIEAGFLRFTSDIDLLVDVSCENEKLVFEALRSLPDKAVNELETGDIDRFTVVRVADEILVDLMKNSCGVTYQEAIQDAVTREIDGVPIPFASPKMLWKMKQTYREKDIPDRLFLRKLLAAQGIHVEETPKTVTPKSLRRWLTRVFGDETGEKK